MYSANNNMDPGPIPYELADLTYVEQMLIVRVHPVVSLFRLNGNQYFYTGNVINFKQNVQEFIDELPIDHRILPVTFVINKTTVAGVTQFRVRSENVLSALVWLKKNNIYYKSVVISYENLRILPTDGNVLYLLPNVSSHLRNNDNIEFDDLAGSDKNFIRDNSIVQLGNIDQQRIIDAELHLNNPSTEELMNLRLWDTTDSSSIDAKSGYYQFKPKRDDSNIQRFNNVITQIWRADTDLTSILDLHAVISYVAKYASKAETSSKLYVEIMNDLCRHSNENTTARSIIIKLIISCCTEDKVCKNIQSVIDKCITRPAEYENLSLLQFVKTITTVGLKYRKNIKEKIVIVYLKYVEGDLETAELYYKQQCMLQIPFQNNVKNLVQHINSEYQKWYSLYTEYELSPVNSLDMTNSGEVCYSDNEEENDEKRSNAFELLSSTVSENLDESLGQRLIDVTHDWSFDNCKYPSTLEVTEFLSKYKNISASALLQKKEKKMRLSSDQRKVFDLCKAQIDHIKFDKTDHIYMRIIVQGKAGSGTSTIISIKFEPLSGESLRKYQLSNKNIKFVIIDEMSMVGGRLLHQIEKRCHDLFPTSDEPFAGLFVYMFSDFKQLPPVKDSPLYYNTSKDSQTASGSIASNSFEKFVELTTTHRQDGDVVFAEMLERVACGTITTADYKLLANRRRSIGKFTGTNTGGKFVNNFNFLTSMSNKFRSNINDSRNLVKTNIPVEDQIIVMHRLDHSIHIFRLWVIQETRIIAKSWSLKIFFLITKFDVVHCVSFLTQLKIHLDQFDAYAKITNVQLYANTKMRAKIHLEIIENMQLLEKSPHLCMDILSKICQNRSLRMLRECVPDYLYKIQNFSEAPIANEYVSLYCGKMI
uniref:ATP-dependent DNA helicase n=1 Tax=Trichogramma kaykai TaxID=54128 RepID=A0ABD2W733_9HYME